jgi:hypothetical protein
MRPAFFLVQSIPLSKHAWQLETAWMLHGMHCAVGYGRLVSFAACSRSFKIGTSHLTYLDFAMVALIARLVQLGSGSGRRRRLEGGHVGQFRI